MPLPLVVMELVKSMKCLSPFAVTTVDEAGVLGGAVLFPMALKVPNAAKGRGASWVAAGKALGINPGASSRWSSSG